MGSPRELPFRVDYEALTKPYVRAAGGGAAWWRWQRRRTGTIAVGSLGIVKLGCLLQAAPKRFVGVRRVGDMVHLPRALPKFRGERLAGRPEVCHGILALGAKNDKERAACAADRWGRAVGVGGVILGDVGARRSTRRLLPVPWQWTFGDNCRNACGWLRCAVPLVWLIRGGAGMRPAPQPKRHAPNSDEAGIPRPENLSSHPQLPAARRAPNPG